MKVILLQNIKNIGRAGDIKNVSDGYAKNFLLPKSLAKIATDNSIKEAEALRAKAELQMKVERETAVRVAENLKGSKVEFTKKVSKVGTLFASITSTEIAKTLSQKAGAKIEADMVNLSDFGGHIKHAGSHIITLELTPEVTAQVEVLVTPEQN